MNEAPAIKRVDISVHFTDSSEIEYKFPLDLMDRRISHVEIDGVRYLRARERDWDDVEVTD